MLRSVGSRRLPVARAQLQASSRRHATTLPPPSASKATPSDAPGGPIKPKKSITRRVLSPVLTAVVVFYGASVPLGYASLRYRDFLVETVPGGEQIGDWLDRYDMQTNQARLSPDRLAQALKDGKQKKETELTRYAESKAKSEGWQLSPPATTTTTTGDNKAAAKATAESVKSNAHQAAQSAKDKVVNAANQVKEAVKDVSKPASTVVKQAEDTVHKAEETIKDKVIDPVKEALPTPEEPESKLPIYAQKPRDVDATPVPPKRAPTEPYTAPLPVDFEPPPGYSAPAGRAVKGELKPVAPKPAPMPLVAPTVQDVATNEPLLGEIAGTIDSLASFVANNETTASADARHVLENAQKDMKKLASRLQDIRDSESKRADQELKKQADEYSSLLLKAEKDLVDRLDTQEEDWKKAFDAERQNLVAAYKEKLERELAAQQAIIDERLREEVVRQGIEMQKRWTEQIKAQVENERGGRLAKLQELEGGVRRLQKVATENEENYSEVVKSRRIFSAIKALEHAISTGSSFRAELTALRRLTEGSSSDKDSKKSEASDSLASTALSTIPESVVKSGIVSFPALATRFHASVAPQLKRVALFPDDGGLFAYLTSVLGSYFLFRREGWSEGKDVTSVIARAEWWLDRKDLDRATREVNSLTGWPKKIASDWLEASRRHLEVRQALEIAEAEATADSLKAL